MKPYLYAAILVSLAGSACSKESDDDNDVGIGAEDMSDMATSDDGAQTDVGDEDTSTGDMAGGDDGNPTDVGGDMGGGDMSSPADCSTATALALGADRAGVIDIEGARQFFAVTPEADGQWLEIVVTPTGPFELVSVVWDPTDTQVAFGQATPADSSAKHVVYRAFSTDRLCVEVAELGDYSGDAPSAGADHTFVVSAAPYLDATYQETEPNDDGASADTFGLTTAADGSRTFEVLADYLVAGNDDWFLLSPPRGTPQMLRLELLPQGPDGHGGTTNLGAIEVLSGDFTSTRYVSIDAATGLRELIFEVPEDGMGLNDVLIHTTAPGSLGANPFYHLRGRFVDEDKQRETIFDVINAENDSFFTPELATPTPELTGQSYGFAGDFYGPTDVDHWSFFADAGQELQLRCVSQRIGSAARDLEIRLLGSTAADVIQSEVEVATADLVWGPLGTMPAVTLPNMGTYTIAIDPGSLDAAVASSYYMCELQVIDP